MINFFEQIEKEGKSFSFKVFAHFTDILSIRPWEFRWKYWM